MSSQETCQADGFGLTLSPSAAQRSSQSVMLRWVEDSLCIMKAEQQGRRLISVPEIFKSKHARQLNATRRKAVTAIPADSCSSSVWS